MDILQLNSVTPEQPEIKESSSNDMGRDTFLKLLVAQLENQDPLSPLESTEFTAQLAQFTSLEQLNKINDNIKYIQHYQASMNNTQAVTFVNKTITASGNSISINDGVASDIMFELEGNVDNAFVNIYDSVGNLIKIMGTGSRNAGMNTVAWDGTDNSGKIMQDGLYTFEVQAADINQDPVNVKTFLSGRVDGVTFKDDTAYLLTGNKEIPIGNIISVTE